MIDLLFGEKVRIQIGGPGFSSEANPQIEGG